MFYGVLYNKGKELELKIHAAGNIEDHVHVIVSIPPKLAVADCVRHLKGASTYAINQMAGRLWCIDCRRAFVRDGYGVCGETEGTSPRE